jgi:hypothetical protein
MIKNKFIKKAVSAAVCLTLTFSFLISGFSVFAQQDEASIFSDTEIQLINAVDTDFITEKIEYVHDNIGARLVGTPADEASAEYFASVFEDFGYLDC